MTEIRDRGAIRRILAEDPAWAIYALGDLQPGMFEASSWYAPGPGSNRSIVLLYRGFDPPVLFATGDPDDISSMLREIREPRVYLHVRPDTAAKIKQFYCVSQPKSMWRMVLDKLSFRPPAEHFQMVRNGVEDFEGLQRLYSDGVDSGEAPAFFAPSMIERGIFISVAEGREFISVAGTHLAVPEESVGAIGCVYTRRDRRGRGLAAQVTAAVARELLCMGIKTVALNVDQRNAPAIRVYERLGFVRYCEFVEGHAERI